MAFGIEILEKYISTCVSCVHNREGLCGFIDGSNRTDEPDPITLGEWEMMSSEEIDLMHTRDWGTPCSKQLTEEQLIDKLENVLEEDDITPTESQVKKVITQCYKLVHKARRNDGSFEGDFDRAVEQGVNVILSYLDLRSLEGGKDISDLLSMYPFGYYRDKGLYRYCPKSIADNYLKDIHDANKHNDQEDIDNGCPYFVPRLDTIPEIYTHEFQSLDFFSRMQILNAKIQEILNKLKEFVGDDEDLDEDILDTGNDKSRSPSMVELNVLPAKMGFFEDRGTKNLAIPVLDEYIRLYGGNNCSKYLNGVLARIGIQSPASLYSGEAGLEWLAKNYNRDAKYQIMMRTPELMSLVSSEIKQRKDDSHELDKYIFSLFKIVEDTAKVLNPSKLFETGDEIRAIFRCLRKYWTSDFNTFRAMWLASKDKAQKLIDDGLVPDELSLIDITEGFLMMYHEKFFDGKSSPEVENFAVISVMYDSLVGIIEAALLENSIRHDIFYYQSKFGIYLTDSIDDIQITCANSWPIKTVRTFATELGHNIKFSTKDFIQKFDQFGGARTMLGDVSFLEELTLDAEPKALTCIDDPRIPDIFRTDKACELLSRLVSAGYCSDPYTWIDKTQKVIMCQCAHVIGGILRIPDKRKWKPFNDLWEVEGLAQSYNKRCGRALDKEILELYPEYKGK